MTLERAKAIVLKEFPSAYYDEALHAVCIYSEGTYLGEGLMRAAWLEAAKKVKGLEKGKAIK